MKMAQFHNVELVTSNGNALYLMHVPGFGMEWSRNAEDAFRYEDIEEAEADALEHGGEVSSFGAPDWHHNEAARLEAHFLHLVAAE
jgi:hypothetical protein